MSTSGHINATSASASQLRNSNSDATLNDNNSNANNNNTNEILTSRHAPDTLEATSSPEKDLNQSLVQDESIQVSAAAVEAGQARATAAAEARQADSKEVDQVNKDDGGGDEQNYLSFGPRLILITVCLMLAVFCMTLDNTVRSLGIPVTGRKGC